MPTEIHVPKNLTPNQEGFEALGIPFCQEKLSTISAMTVHIPYRE